MVGSVVENAIGNTAAIDEQGVCVLLCWVSECHTLLSHSACLHGKLRYWHVPHGVTWSSRVLTACCVRVGTIKVAETAVEATSCGIEANNQQYIEAHKNADACPPPCTPSIAICSGKRLLPHAGCR